MEPWCASALPRGRRKHASCTTSLTCSPASGFQTVQGGTWSACSPFPSQGTGAFPCRDRWPGLDCPLALGGGKAASIRDNFQKGRRRGVCTADLRGPDPPCPGPCEGRTDGRPTPTALRCPGSRRRDAGRTALHKPCWQGSALSGIRILCTFCFSYREPG